MKVASRSFEPAVPRAAGERLADQVRARPYVVPLVVILVSFVIFPPEARLSVSGLNLPLYRLGTIAFLFWALMTFARNRVRFGLVDALVLGCSAWIAISFFEVYGSARGTYSGVANWLDVAGAYLVARAAVRSPDDLRLVLRLIALPLLLSGLMLLVESLDGDLIVRPAAARIFGTLPSYYGGVADGQLVLNREYRLGGFLRAFGVFSHPILAGSILASSIPLYWFGGLERRYRLMGVAAGLLGFFSLSSAALIAIALSIALIAADFLRSRVRGASWWTVSTVAVLVAASLQLASQNGLINVIIRNTFDPSTASYRLTIWKYGLLAVRENPWFGIGYEVYNRPRNQLPSASVDAHFLALALSSGIIAAYALLAATIAAMLKLGFAVSAGRGRGRDRDLLFAVNAALVILFFASMTVTFYNEARVWFMVVIALAASMGQLRAAARPSAPVPVPA